MLKFILEIKTRFFLLLTTWASVFIIFYFYKEVLLFLVICSHSFPNFTSSFYFIFTDVTEVFSVYLTLTFFFSSQIVCIFLIYHFFSFFAPATFKFEYLYLVTILQIIVYFWIFSIILTNLFLIPLAWNFFLDFCFIIPTSSLNLYFEASLTKYIYFYINTCYICIFYLQIFTIFFFSYTKINERYVIKFRKIYYYAFTLFSTLLSPPDVLSQILISFLIICFFEIFLFITFFRKKLV